MNGSAMDSWQLTTPRLLLRRLIPGDKPALLEMLGDYEVVKNLARWPHPVQPDMIDDLIARHQTDQPGGFAIIYGDELAGLISEGAGIGFMLSRRFWGVGIMTEALAAVQNHLMTTKSLEALHGGAFVDNPASIRVFEKCGWREVPGQMQFCPARGHDVQLRDFVKCARYDWLEPVHTDRLILRPAGPQDFEAIHEIVADKELAEILLWPWPASAEITRDRLTNAKARAGLVSAVTLNGEPIGRVSAGGGTIGFMIRRAFWGKGYATEAVTAKIAQAFQSPDVTTLTAGAWEGNHASKRILEKLGFEQIGWGKQHAPAKGADLEGPQYRLTRTAWEALH